jgi:hypothetical protein
VAVGKKWYSYFVVTDDRTDPAEASTVADATPQRVSDAFPDAKEEPELPAAAVVSANLGAVYEAAKIAAPAHGYTVLKVAEMLQSEHIRALPAEVKRKSVMVALDAAGVKVADVVEDAVRRDRALDAYERVLQKSLDDLRARTSAENQHIEDEITQRVAELRARITENNQRITTEQDEFLAWLTHKRQEEETIAEAVSYFVSENPITTRTIVKGKGDADVR